MGLLEKLIYSSILFLAIYVIISVALRAFEVTSTYTSHLIGGVVSLVGGFGLFMYLLLKK